MTPELKRQIIERFLDNGLTEDSPGDVSAVMSLVDAENSFLLESGSNEGCFMHIGEYCYRCSIRGQVARSLFKSAVALYLTLVD